MQETWVQFLGWQDPLEKEMATHSSILAWRIPWTGACQTTVHGVARVGLDLASKPPNVDSVLKSRDITLLTKVRIVKPMIFPVVMYECENWIVKKAKCRKIDAFELWTCRKLESPWAARRSNQAILKEINPEYSLEGLMWKLQYFGHLMRRAESLEKTLMVGKAEGKRRRG